MPSEAAGSLLGRRLFVESFDVSGFIFLGFCHPFHLWRAPTVGESGAALDKKCVLVEGTRGSFTGNWKCGLWPGVAHICQGYMERRGVF